MGQDLYKQAEMSSPEVADGGFQLLFCRVNLQCELCTLPLPLEISVLTPLHYITAHLFMGASVPHCIYLPGLDRVSRKHTNRYCLKKLSIDPGNI